MNTQWSRLLIWLFGGWLLISGSAFADGYNKGLDAFRDGEYSKAYKILSGVVKKAKDKSDKAEAMALKVQAMFVYANPVTGVRQNCALVGGDLWASTVRTV